MAKNVLTPAQDLLVREFYLNIALHIEAWLPSTPVAGRMLRRTLLDLLNYDQIGSGAYITKGTSVSIKYGTRDYSAYPNEWDDDVRRAEEALLNEEDNNTDTSEAGASESSQDTEIRETVLSEDVS